MSSFAEWADAGGILYADRKKASAWLPTQPAMLAGGITKQLASENVASEESPVNGPKFQSKKAEDAYAKVLNDINKQIRGVVDLEVWTLKDLGEGVRGGEIVSGDQDISEERKIRTSLPKALKHPRIGNKPINDKQWRELAIRNLEGGLGLNSEDYQRLIEEKNEVLAAEVSAKIKKGLIPLSDQSLPIDGYGVGDKAPPATDSENVLNKNPDVKFQKKEVSKPEERDQGAGLPLIVQELQDLTSKINELKQAGGENVPYSLWERYKAVSEAFQSLAKNEGARLPKGDSKKAVMPLTGRPARACGLKNRVN
jgi:hypothetical protein